MDLRPQVISKREGGILKLRLNNPPNNYLSQKVIHQLSNEIEEVRGDENLKCIVFSSAVDKVFSHGFDFKDLTQERVGGIVAAFGHLLSLLNIIEAITIVEVDGVCTGSGLELGAYSDIILASERSTFGHPEVKFGVFPPVAAALYTHLIGRNRAIDLLITGEIMSAEAAYDMHLLTHVWDEEEFKGKVNEYYEALETKNAHSLHMTKRAIEKSLYERVTLAVNITEDIYLNDLLPTPEAMEGINAKLQNRKPNWTKR
ncbi:enoyl-CoA hydratase/isomerase family protein [bacterium]|nr:enoyl-CoA hydratase/isomerase family protein [bacterium]